MTDELDEDDKLKILKHITLGTKEVFYYPYNGGKEPLPLRPLSSFELDQCFYNALKFCGNKTVVQFVIKYRLAIIKGNDSVDLSKISSEAYNDLIRFYNNINYWIVYYSMKDFQSDEFSMPDFDFDGQPNGYHVVQSMEEVHDIAEFVIESTRQPKQVIKEILSDYYGREIAYCIHYLKIPLADISSITPLQREYIICSNGKLDKLAKEDLKKHTYSVSGKEMTYKEFLDGVWGR